MWAVLYFPMDQKEYLQEYPDEMFSVEYDMTNEEAINI